MNAAPFMVCLVLAIGFAVAIPWAIRYDRLMAELEGLDDESLAEAWEREGR